MKLPRLPVLLALVIGSTPRALPAETPIVPDWARPGSSTHQQVPPPADFHRPTVTDAKPIGIFEGQSDIGGPLLPGDSSYDPAAKRYTISSASYNIWYRRDEFRYLWKKVSGDVSLATDIAFPNPKGYDDRKVVLVIRQDLDDSAKEVMTALHGAGLIHLAFRPETGANIKESYRIKGAASRPGEPLIRIGIEKHGDTFALFVSQNGEPLHQLGATAEVHFDGPFYVGIGFCSHVPDQRDTALVTNVVFENAAGKVR